MLNTFFYFKVSVSATASQQNSYIKGLFLPIQIFLTFLVNLYLFLLNDYGLLKIFVNSCKNANLHSF